MADELSGREEELLFGLILEYVDTRSPVGSRVLAERSSEGLSSATVRSILASLEDRGYLAKARPSSGREPTDAAYGYFASRILERVGAWDGPDMQEVERLVQRGSLTGVVRNAVKLLARSTRTLGFAVKPLLDDTRLRVCEFVRFASDRVLMILVSKSGDVQEHILKTDEDFGTATLRTFSNYLNERYNGWSFGEIRAHLRRQIDQTLGQGGRGPEKALALAAPFFLGQQQRREVCHDGLRDLLASMRPGEALEGIHLILESLETRSRLLELLDEFAGRGRQVRVIMGRDLPVHHADNLSMVVSSYATSSGSPGLVGVIGPKSMRYDTAIPLVCRMAWSVSLAGTRL